MRNPLNSINAQIQSQKVLLREMRDAFNSEGGKEECS